MAALEKSGQTLRTLVRPKGKRFEIVDGHRSMEDAKKAKLKTVKAIVRKYNNHQASALIGITSNLLRGNFNPVSETRTLAWLKENYGWGPRRVAKFLGGSKSKSLVHERLAMSRLPSKVLNLVQEGKLGVEHVELIRKQVPEKFLEDEALHIANKGYSFEQTKAYVETQKPSYKVHSITQVKQTPSRPEIKPSEANHVEKNGNSTILGLDPVIVEMPWLRYLLAVTKCPFCKEDRAVDFSRTKFSSTKDQLVKIRSAVQEWLDTNLVEAAPESRKES